MKNSHIFLLKQHASSYKYFKTISTNAHTDIFLQIIFYGYQFSNILFDKDTFTFLCSRPPIITLTLLSQSHSNKQILNRKSRNRFIPISSWNCSYSDISNKKDFFLNFQSIILRFENFELFLFVYSFIKTDQQQNGKCR